MTIWLREEKKQPLLEKQLVKEALRELLLQNENDVEKRHPLSNILRMLAYIGCASGIEEFSEDLVEQVYGLLDFYLKRDRFLKTFLR